MNKVDRAIHIPVNRVHRELEPTINTVFQFAGEPINPIEAEAGVDGLAIEFEFLEVDLDGGWRCLRPTEHTSRR
ncbi:MAG: hypothetical protein ACF8MJ_01730, partial [Phycisphaerales bacterium JB050]